MSIRKTATRNIDNRRLYSLTIGEVYLPSIGKHVPWEAYGERAAVMMADRRPGLTNVISQPERLRLSVNGKFVAYTPDYELEFEHTCNEVHEVKGERQLHEQYMQDKLAEAENTISLSGRRFCVLNSRDITNSTELRNVQLMRRYALWPINEEQTSAVLSAFHQQNNISLHDLVKAAFEHAISKAQIYNLIYRGVLSMDWNTLIQDGTLISRGRDNANV